MGSVKIVGYRPSSSMNCSALLGLLPAAVSRFIVWLEGPNYLSTSCLTPHQLFLC